MPTTYEKAIALCAYALCSGMDCTVCHELFNNEDCPASNTANGQPIDRSEYQKLTRYILENLQAMNTAEITDFNEEDLLRIINEYPAG